jgi:transcriptional regulator with XRE-family HTH domain
VSTAEASPGTLLRDWRRRRRLSQLDLALEAGVSARHVSFLEAHLLDRLRRQVAVTGDERLAALRDELDAYPGGEATLPAHEPGIAVPLRLDAGGAELRFLSTISTFGTAVDITLAELAIEAFFPADEETADYVRGATRPSSSARAGAPSASNRTA